ncbi:hypothetical protein C5167_047118 [Papaver somniferum]|uniref:Uncharacterized protein n=1 Tax=Papaver somniferum TaxID=3469 RepID=A0A4Y7LJB2_PAPSO|nr:hypothetical protein C5167_047118 [Papaver somniferum]
MGIEPYEVTQEESMQQEDGGQGHGVTEHPEEFMHQGHGGTEHVEEEPKEESEQDKDDAETSFQE